MTKLRTAIIAIAALAIGYAASAETVTPGTDGTSGDIGPAYLDYSTNKLWCSQAPGISVQLPAQGSPVSWPACSTVQVVSTDICSNTAGGCPILDTNSRLPPAQVPPIPVVTPVGMVCAGKTNTTTSTSTATSTGTLYQTSAQPVTCTVTASGGTLYLKDGLYAITATSTSTATASATASGTGTSTGTGTLPSTQTLTFTGSQINTGTAVATSPVYSWTQTSTTTAAHAVTATSLTTLTLTNTVTVTGTATLTRSGTISGTASVTLTATVTGTSGATATATVTGTQTTTAVATTTQTATVSASSTFTQSQTFTASLTTITAETGTGTGTAVLGGGNYTATGTVTNTGAVTSTGTFTGGATATATFTGSVSGTATGTVTDTSSATATSATVASNPTIGYVAPATPVIGGDLFLGFNGANIVSFNPYPTDSGDIAKTLSAGGAAQDVVPGDSGYGYQCEGTGTHFCTILTASAGAKWVPHGNIAISLWAKSTSPVTLTMTVGMYNGYSIISTIFTQVFSVSSASWTQFTASYSIVDGIYVVGSPWGIAAEFTAQDAAAGAPTVTIGVASPHRFYLNGPWIQSGAKP